MFFLSFFHGNVLAGIFSSDAMVIEAAADYLKAYAIDCLFTAIFFCYIGFYNGIGMTKFVMIQGIIGAFCVRVPVSWFMSRRAGATLFDIGAGNTVFIRVAAGAVSWMYVVSEKEKTGVGYRVNVFRNVVCPSVKNCAKMSRE